MPLFHRPQLRRSRGAASVGVLTTQGRHDAENLRVVLGEQFLLDMWLREASKDALSLDASGVAAADDCIRMWRSDPKISPQLGNQMGLFLGTVIVASAHGGWRWHLDADDHPVVRNAKKKELDVVALANQLVADGSPTLLSVYEQCEAEASRDRSQHQSS